MKNLELSEDYLLRAGHRLAAIEVLLARQSFADVVRECQEVVELCLKAVLLKIHVDVPRLHDVSDVLINEKDKLGQDMQRHLPRVAKISKSLRRDRELAFYGAPDVTPSQFYAKTDAETALADATWIYELAGRC
jgi:HEPN domain-containing protein